MKNKPAINDFGKRMARFRKAGGLTQQQLGDQLGVSRRVIAYYEAETDYPPAHIIVPGYSNRRFTARTFTHSVPVL